MLHEIKAVVELQIVHYRPPMQRKLHRGGDVKSSLLPFVDPATVASYTEQTPKKVPGLTDLHRMTTFLLSERAKPDAHILVVGAGGGLELSAMAQARPHWKFTGVDPSSAMLDVARHVTEPYSDQIELCEGTVDQLSLDSFDGATCLLTLHFLDRTERLRTLIEIRQRLKAGSALVIAHHANPDGHPQKWLARSAAFAVPDGQNSESAAASAKAMAERLTLLSPIEEEKMLLEAGFAEPSLFYAALSFRGWVAFAD
ncbi:class I SAM-dependent methyltransferase [Ochrobactrum sp. Q0168]|uniref:class I SAM-dependent methyltransferase n=1 Tax=Ochrobactrum sp. Q0168 TaxID=2793241 RepID=UPI001FFF81FC